MSHDLVAKLKAEDRILMENAMRNISPDDAKYIKTSQKLAEHLSADAEWRMCAEVQKVLLETRVEFGQADKKNLEEVKAALPLISPLNMALIEEQITKHDQLAVIEEIGRFVSPETKALLHPGTTSYCILDTARSVLLKRAWNGNIRPTISSSIKQLVRIAEESKDLLQVGRTHLQSTSPVPMALTFSGYAARVANRVEVCDWFFDDLRGKVSGIVGTGASVEMVIGEGKALEFEEAVLKKLGLKPDYTATQVVQKERLADVGHGIVTLVHVLGEFAGDIRKMYSTAIGEVTSRDAAARLGGSSADATKNNPIQFENIEGKVVVVESGMRVLYAMIASDFQRDLRSSVQARYQPQPMMVQAFESFSRLEKALKQLSINEDKLEENLEYVRKNPGEAMTAILRGEGFLHPDVGNGHDFVKKTAIKAKLNKVTLIEQALEDNYFSKVFSGLSDKKRRILQGEMELYIGSSHEKVKKNIEYALSVANK